MTDEHRIAVLLPPERVGTSEPHNTNLQIPNHAMAYRPDIDGVRAIAVVAVVLFHAKVAGFAGGFVGVDVFFVISGYLISGIIVRGITRGDFTFRDFYARRVNRIFPALLVVLLATFAIGWYLLLPHEFVSLGKHVAASAAFLSNLAIFKETGYFDVIAEQKPLLHLWSLAIAEQFYLVWPLLLVIIWRTMARPNLVAIAMGATSFAFAASMAFTQHAQTSFYFPFSRLWELVAGYALYNFERSRQSWRVRRWTSWTGLLLIVASILLFDGKMAWPSAWTIVPVAGTILILWGGNDGFINRSILSHRLAVGIGLISYPLYLWHWPLLSFVRFVETPGTRTALTASAILVSIVLAFLTYRVIEWPFRARVAGRRKRAVLLVAAMAVVCAVGALAWADKVGPRLDSPLTRAIQEAILDWTYPGGSLRINGDINPQIIPGAKTDTVVFAGDSNMEQFWPRAEFLVKRSSGTLPTTIFTTVGGCPMLPNVGLSFSLACNDFYAHTLEYMRKPGVRAVVIGAAWDRLFSMKILYRRGDPTRTPLGINDAVTDSVFREFEQDIASLVSAGKRVYVILQIPGGGKNDEFDPVTWLPSRLQPIPRTAMVTSIARQEFVNRTASTLNRIRESAERAHATVLDPVAYLCDQDRCPTVDSKGAPLYRDGVHIRAKTARERALFIDKVYDGFLDQH